MDVIENAEISFSPRGGTSPQNAPCSGMLQSVWQEGLQRLSWQCFLWGQQCEVCVQISYPSVDPRGRSHYLWRSGRLKPSQNNLINRKILNFFQAPVSFVVSPYLIVPNFMSPPDHSADSQILGKLGGRRRCWRSWRKRGQLRGYMAHTAPRHFVDRLLANNAKICSNLHAHIFRVHMCWEWN
jgi:hypothetical protein